MFEHSAYQELLARYQQAQQQASSCMFRHPWRSMAETLKQLAQQAEHYSHADVYGSGALINELEDDIAALLGKPAALFLPSGTLAQPLALRIHADARQKTGVALHATSHLLLHEQQGMEHLWGLTAQRVGAADRPILSADLTALPTAQVATIAALVVELPAREIGGQLPPWDDLCQQAQWAKQQGIAVHIDGARLWQCPGFYQRSLADIAALADSVYVSLYKDLGGISGAILAADADFIATAKIWARRAGGNLASVYPLVLAAQQGLQRYLGSMTTAVAYAQRLAVALSDISQLVINPMPPQAAMFHLHIPIPPQQLLALVVDYAEQHGILLLPPSRSQQRDCSCCEITIGTATMAHAPQFWAHHLQQCLAPALNLQGESSC